MGFRTHLEQAKSTTGKPLDKSTARAIMAVMREFVIWLSQQEGCRSRIKTRDAEYFNLSRRDEAEARAAPERPAPSLTQAKRALSLMPASTPREMRDKAVFSLLCLTGIRVPALVLLRIKHIDLLEKSVTDLDEKEFYGPDDPLFPATALKASAKTGFQAEGFDRRPWKSTAPVRKIVNGAFQTAKLSAFGPPAFRHMLARHATRTCTSVAEFVATSQNLGHTDVLTTLRSYGQIDCDRMRALITGETGGDLLEE